MSTENIVTVDDVLRYNRILKSIIDNAKDVNALVKFKLLGMCKQFEPIVANFEIVQNEKIIQYGNTTKNGNTGIIKPNRDDFENDKDFEEAEKKYDEAIEKFSNDLNEVLNSKADIDIVKFKYTDIIDAGLPADYLLAIYELIEE